LIDSDRLPHALLLHGDAGTPKLALARAAAQYLSCQHHTADGDSCGECRACRQHETFNHTETNYSFPIIGSTQSNPINCDDFMVEWRKFLTDCSQVESYEHWLHLLKNDNAQPLIPVAESANIIRKMSLSTYASRYKVFILWLPEKMNESAANKLLKLIEEPYDDCKFILVSDNARAILPTIFSRCQRIELQRPTAEEIADYLADAYSMSHEDAFTAAGAADGNVLQAMQSLQKGSEQAEFLQEFVSLMRTAYVRDLGALKRWSDGVADFKREKARRFMAYCARQVRENYVYNIGGGVVNYQTPDERQFSSRFAPFINSKNVEKISSLIDSAQEDIRQNANARIVLFHLALNIALLIR